jgi:prepilin peptidase CpaA
MTGEDGMHVLALVGTAVGAGWDLRKGTLPNWLTLSLLAAGPAIAFAIYGTGRFLDSCLGACLCAFIPFLAFRSNGMGGGDVKLFAAVGALLGWQVGFEAQFFAMVAASIASLVVLAYKRQLLTAFSNLFYLAFNRILPQKWRRDVTQSLRTELRIGPYIFVGTAAAVLLQHPSWLGMTR